MNDKIEQRARELLAVAERGPIAEYGVVHRRTAHQAITAALREQAAPKPEAQAAGEWPMTEAEVRQWIRACNHVPARQVLRDYLKLRALSTPASHDAQQRPNVDVQAEARRILADEYRRAGYMGAMDDALDDDPSPHCKVTLKAIERALAQQPAVVGDGVLNALRNYEQADADGTFVKVSRQALDEAIAALTPAATPGDPEWEECPECSIGNGMRRGCDICDGSGSVPAAQKEGNGNG